MTRQAEPWPSAAEVHEIRAKHMEAQRAGKQPEKEGGAAAVAAGSAPDSARKRKRKRRG